MARPRQLFHAFDEIESTPGRCAAPSDRICKEFGVPAGNRWATDMDCCARDGDAGCKQDHGYYHVRGEPCGGGRYMTCCCPFNSTCAQAVACQNSCVVDGYRSHTGNGVCEDGREGSASAVCPFGTDCTDCGAHAYFPERCTDSPHYSAEASDGRIYRCHDWADVASCAEAAKEWGIDAEILLRSCPVSCADGSPVCSPPPAPPDAPSPSSDSSSGLEAAALVGIVLGAVAFVATACLCALLFRRRRAAVGNSCHVAADPASLQKEPPRRSRTPPDLGDAEVQAGDADSQRFSA